MTSPLSTHVHKLAGEEVRYQFEERVGMCIAEHIPEREAEILVYRQIFNTEPPEEFLK